MPPRFRPVFLFGLTGMLAGCSMPKAAYRQVDHETPAFKAAVAQETEHQQAAGKSKAAAEKIATNKTDARFAQNEKDRRLALTAPLIQAMEALEKPRGCWAYTVTTTVRQDGQLTLTDVVRYDPFQPEEKIWTLVSRNGAAPDEVTQADFRAKRLKAWHKDLERQAKARLTDSELVRWNALSTQFEAPVTTPDSATTFTFHREPVKMLGLADIPPSDETFTVDHATLVRRTSAFTNPGSALAGTMTMDYEDSALDYAVIDPAVPPFVVKRVAHWRIRFLGKDSGAMERVEVYTDYHRVKCYDDRFETRIGTPNVMEFAPN